MKSPLLRRWNLRNRMLLLFHLMLLLLLVCAWLAYTFPSKTAPHYRALEQRQKTANMLTHVGSAVQEFRIKLLRTTLFATLTPNNDLTPFYDGLREAEDALNNSLLTVRPLDPSLESHLRSLLPDANALVLTAVQFASTGRGKELAAQFAPLNPRFDQLNELLARNINTALAEEQARLKLLRQIEARQWQRTQLCLALCLLIAARVTWLLYRGVLSPLAQVKQKLDALTTHSDSADAVQLPTHADEFQRVGLALDKLKITQKSLNELAFINSVSGLANRHSLRLDLENRQRLGQTCALLLVDLDHFRTLNEALGPQAGDDCLRQFGQRLTTIAEPADRIFHFSGDLFALLLSGQRDLVSLAENVAGRVRELCTLPVNAAGQQIRISVSMGVALMPEHGNTAATLVNAAESAVHDAKQQDRTRVQFAKSDVSGRAQRNLILAEDIRRGLRQNEFVSYFQPIINLETGKVVCAEALMRWQHPDAGLVLPGRFIDVAEYTGELARISEQLFLNACRQFAAWTGDDAPTLAFNFSPREINEHLPGRIRNALDLSGLPGHRLEIEITETALMQRPDEAATVLHQLRKMGVGVSLDDFGTGYSSLSLLQRLPVTKIKLDRSFVITLGTSREAYSIVSAITGIARNLNLKMVAEGMETQKQLNHLMAVGCTLVQGFYFSKGIPFEDLRQWSPSSILNGAQAADQKTETA